MFNSKEYHKDYNIKNKIKRQIQRRNNYLNNKIKVLTQNKQWRELNKNKMIEYVQKYRKSEKYKNSRKKYLSSPRGRLLHRVHKHNRRLLTKNLSLITIQRVYEDNIKKYGTLTCYLCEKPIQFGNDTLDHKTPISRGGSNLYENLDIAHSSCNDKKGNKLLKECGWSICKVG